MAKKKDYHRPRKIVWVSPETLLELQKKASEKGITVKELISSMVQK